jgi:hypothetical protein
MAGQGSRTLKLSILADVDQLKKSLAQANGDVDNSSSKMGDFGKKAGLAFAAAGAAAAAYAGKLLVEGVQSAIADEAAQAKLAKTLGNVTGATDLQVAATEAYILKTSLANGITDDVLRPSLERLVRATKDVEQAQKLQSLALDISAGSGKSLEAVSNALAKSAEGQNTALGKLGIGIDAATLKTMSFDEVTLALADTFGGQASEKADTFAGKMDRLKVAVDEGKETVGAFVLDAITPMVSYLNDNVIPVIQTLSTSIGENLKPVFENISTFFKDTFVPALSSIWLFIKDKIVPVFQSFLKPVIEGIRSQFGALKDIISENAGFFHLLKIALDGFWTLAKIVAPFIGGAFKLAFNGIAFIIDGISLAIKGLIAGLNLAISVVNGLISGYNIVNNLVGGKDLPKIPKLAAGGPVSSNSPYIVGEVGPELFVPSSSGKIVPNNKLSSGSTGATINLTVNGAIDSEGTARTIINTLNDSFYRGTGGSTGLVTA